MLRVSNKGKRLLETQVSLKVSDFKDAFGRDPDLIRFFKEDLTLFVNLFFRSPFDREKNFLLYAWQDLVAADKGSRVCVCVARQCGKSTVAALMAVHFAYFHDNCTVLVVSKTFNQAVEFVDRIHSLMKSSSFTNWDALKPSEKESKAVVKIRNKGGKSYSRILSLPATDAARGYTADLVICDELAFWENGDYVFNQVIEPTTQATKGKIIAISTPNGEQGLFYRIFNSPNWSSYQFDWRVNPFTTDAEMLVKKSEIGLLEFQSEYGAEFVSAKNAYFLPSEIRRAVSGFEYKPSSGVVGIGVDIGKHLDNAVIFVGCVDNPSDDRDVQVLRVLERRVKPLGTKYSSLVAEVKDLALRYRASSIAVDATGSGEGPAEALQDLGLPVELVKFSVVKKAAVYSSLKKLMEDPVGRIKIPDEPSLVQQLGWMMYEYSSTGNIKIYPPSGAHDDEADALALMAYSMVSLMGASASLEIVPKTGGGSLSVSSGELIYCDVHDSYAFGGCVEDHLDSKE